MTHVVYLVQPPYIDVIANLFSANVMRKSGATAPGAKTGTTPAGKFGATDASKKNLMTQVRSGVSGRSTPYKR